MGTAQAPLEMSQIAYLQLSQFSAELVSVRPNDVEVDLAAGTYTVSGFDHLGHAVQATYRLGEVVKWCIEYQYARPGELFHPLHSRQPRIGMVIVVGDLTHLQTAILRTANHAGYSQRGYVIDD